jgi:signal transduction histidine kinase
LPLDGCLIIRVGKWHEEVYVTVADNGHGISETILQTIFESFFTTKRDQGTGLGLAYFEGDRPTSQG